MMKAKSLKTRALAMLLTLLMLVSALPVSAVAVFADANTPGNAGINNVNEGEEEGYSPLTLSQLEGVLVRNGGLIKFWQDFDSATSTADGELTKALAVNAGGFGFHGNGASLSLVEDGAGGKALAYNNKTNTNLNVYLSAAFRDIASSDGRGKNFVFSMEVKAGEVMTEGQLLCFSSYSKKNDNTSLYTAIPLYVKANGDLYVPDPAASGIVTKLNGWRGNSFGTKIGTISKNSFTAITVEVNTAENWFMVYVDGVAKTGKLLFASNAVTEEYKNAGDKTYTDGRFCPTAVSFGYRPNTGANPATHYYVLDNMFFYYGDKYYTREDLVVTDIIWGEAFRSPTADEIKAKLGDSALVSYFPFDGGSANGGKVGAGSFTRNSNWQFVDDGKGGKAVQTKAQSQQNTTMSLVGHGTQVNTYADKSYVVSMDFKLGAATNTGALFYLYSSVANTYHFTACPVWVDTAGNLYNGQVTANVTGSVSKKVITGGTLWYQNDVGAESAMFCVEDKKIGKLSADKFTNVALAVDPVKNVYSIYIDGVCVAADQMLACENILNYYNECDAANGTVDFGGNFSISAICLGYRNKTSGDSYIFDNVTMYLGNTLVDPTEGNKLIGYKLENGKIYYYEDGARANGGKTFDGIFEVDASGVVLYNGVPIKSVFDYYKYVGNDAVPRDGFYTGVFTVGDNTYCYDAIGRLVKNKEAYDAAANIDKLDPKKDVTGFAIDENGLATPLNGYYHFANGKTYYYVDGVRATGAVEIDGGLYYINNDFSFFSGQKTVDGVTYDFDPETKLAAIRNGVFCDEEKENQDKYYINGVAQTGMINTEYGSYFADANGVLISGPYTNPLTGEKHFFFTSGSDKYKMAVSTTVVYGGCIFSIDATGVIDEVSGKVFGSWAEHDGEYYYSDESGNLMTGIIYIADAPNGGEGGYYFFDENGRMFKNGYANVYDTIMYFGADGKAANGVVAINGTYKHFIDGVTPDGETEVIQDGYRYSFKNGLLVGDRVALDENNPEVLVSTLKDGVKKSFYFKTDGNGIYAMLLYKYPCYSITVYDVTDNIRTVVPINADGRYELAAGRTYDVIYTPVDHTFGDTVISVVEPTCYKDGYNVYACTVDGCNATKREPITERPAHTFPEGDEDMSVIVEPTCITTGIGMVWCTVDGCGNAKTVTIPTNTEHYFSEWEVSPSTCVKAGFKARMCYYCFEMEHEALPLSDHTWGNWTEYVVADCITPGIEKGVCIDCFSVETFRETPVNPNCHFKGNITSLKDANASNFEVFQTVFASTCMTEGTVICRCKSCGGYIYDVKVEKNPENHELCAFEHLAVFDTDGKIIEKIEIKVVEGVNLIYVNGVQSVIRYNVRKTARENMLAASSMVCGYKAEWRTECANNCKVTDEVNGELVWFNTVEAVAETSLHQFDLEVLYTTSDTTDPLYGTHFYLCKKCGKAAGMAAHNYVSTYIYNGKHTTSCSDGCIDVETNKKYSETSACRYDVGFNADGHWYECISCSNKVEREAHTIVDSFVAGNHYASCECGYFEKHTLTLIPQLDPTCYSEGYAEYRLCECGIEVGYKVLEKLPCNIATDKYEYDEVGHWYVCANEGCGARYEAQEHNLVVVPAQAPTCIADGHNEYSICTVCDYKLGYEPIYSNGHNLDDVPFSYSDTFHWQICPTCNEIVNDVHTLGILLNDEEGTKACMICSVQLSYEHLTWWYNLGFDRVTVEIDGKEYYRYTYNGAKDEIVKLNDAYYYFDANGYLVMNGDNVKNANPISNETSFHTITKAENNRGVILDAVLTVGGYTYYFKNGSIKTGWYTINGSDYYFNSALNGILANVSLPEGALVKGSATINALNYAGNEFVTVNTREDGARLLGVVIEDGNAYYYLDGVVGKQTGKIVDNYYNVGKIFIADEDGKLCKGQLVNCDGVYYSFNNDYSVSSHHKSSMLTIGETVIYTDADGRRIVEGWFGKAYILGGEMLKATVEDLMVIIGDSVYGIDTAGVATKYVVGGANPATFAKFIIDGEVSDALGYITEDGLVKNQALVIGDCTYIFDANGKMVVSQTNYDLNGIIYNVDEFGKATKVEDDAE